MTNTSTDLLVMSHESHMAAEWLSFVWLDRIRTEIPNLDADDDDTVEALEQLAEELIQTHHREVDGMDDPENLVDQVMSRFIYRVSWREVAQFLQRHSDVDTGLSSLEPVPEIV